jgi:hypothetical protein
VANKNVDTANIWVGMEKNIRVHCNYLFSETKSSANRMKVKSVLLDKCEPLTVIQRTGDWFVGSFASQVPLVLL